MAVMESRSAFRVTPHDRLFLHRVPVEQLADEVEDQLLPEHERSRMAGHRDQPGHHPVGAGDDAHTALATFGGQPGHSAELLVVQEGERLLPCDDHRREEGGDLPVKQLLQQLPVLRGEAAKVHQPDAVRLQLSHEPGVDPSLFLLQLLDQLQDSLHLLGAGHPGLVVPHGLAGVHMGHQGTHPNHEKLIQIVLENSGKAQPLRQRHPGIPRLVQHPLIKTQPGQLPVGIAISLLHPISRSSFRAGSS